MIRFFKVFLGLNFIVGTIMVQASSDEMMKKIIDTARQVQLQAQRKYDIITRNLPDYAAKAVSCIKVPDIKVENIADEATGKDLVRITADKQALLCGVMAGMYVFFLNEFTLKGNLRYYQWLLKKAGAQNHYFEIASFSKYDLETTVLSVARRTPFFRCAAFLLPTCLMYNYLQK